MFKILVMDVDGTLTDGSIYISNQGECMKCFNVQDGYGIKNVLSKYGILPAIITGRKSEINQKRFGELGIKIVKQGEDDKLTALIKITEEYNVSLKEVAYIGDDLNDLPCMLACGMSGCPNDAIVEVVEKVDYVCKKGGGKGAVREFIDKICSES